MPKEDSAAVLVARFLRTNNYKDAPEKTLEAFLKEAGLPPAAGASSPGCLTIETVLDEKRTFDLSRNFEKIGIDDEETKWLLPAPSQHAIVNTLESSSNILYGAAEDVVQEDITEGQQPKSTNLILASTADRKLNFLNATSPYEKTNLSIGSSDAPILSCLVLDHRFIVSTTMSGRTVLYDAVTQTRLDERTDHRKYVVRAAKQQDETGIWIVTAGWDAKIFCYHLPREDLASNKPKLGQPIAVIDLPSNPEAMIFIHHPEISTPVLLISRRDSTFLYYYGISNSLETSPGSSNRAGPKEVSFTLLGKQNLAPHSNAWIAFTPSAFEISPRDPSLLAVATSSIPHMKLIIVRLLLPPPPSATGETTISPDTQYQLLSSEIPTTTHMTVQGAHSAQARAALAVQDREAAAIQIHATTLAPQTAYSTPDLAWRPDASGVWVNGDDGVVRGIEASTGKVIARLEGGHEPGAKIRCVWAGRIGEQGDKKEVALSGGFDKRLVIWNIAS